MQKEIAQSFDPESLRSFYAYHKWLMNPSTISIFVEKNGWGDITLDTIFHRNDVSLFMLQGIIVNRF